MNIYQTISSETMEKVGDTFSEKEKKNMFDIIALGMTSKPIGMFPSL